MTRMRWLMGWIAAFALIAAPIAHSDTTLGNQEFTVAMDLVATGDFEDAKRAHTLLSQAQKADPAEPLFPRIILEMQILFRGEIGITNAREASRQAQFAANKKLDSMRRALEPSRLTGDTRPQMAARFKLEAEQILEDARIEQERAKHNLALALTRANNFTLELIEKNEPTAAVSVLMAAKAIHLKNAEILAEVEPQFAPVLSETDLADMRVRAKINHEVVAVGLQREKEGNIEKAIELFRKAGYEKGVKRLSERLLQE